MEKFSYDNGIVRKFSYATLIFGVVGMTVGLWIALELAFPQLNVARWVNFGRLRPLHTNAIIFAFVGNAMFTGIYYSLQRLLKARMASDLLSNIHFWGWQFIIVCAAITLPLGYTSSKEYAELEWWIDILIAVVWVIFGWNMFATILKRRVQHLYVAIWFYIATFVTVAVLHIFNSLAIPVDFTKSYSMFAGVQDALIQWWYGHNAVAFFLTTPFLGLMYYFVPKAANRPVYSYRLSIIHFWTLIFLYIWAGPHHLLYTSLPDWAQSLGVAFSIMLLMPSWGGMLNGLLTLRGAWDKVREDPVLKFMVVAITAYGMSTFEGPMLSLKSVNMISHFTDWTVAHVHVGGLGWNGMMTFGMLYFIFPRIFGTKLFSIKLANTHFWLATLGILFWTIPMYWAGFVQGLMWQDFKPDGNLEYEFIDTVEQLKPMFMLRSLGGLIYLTGAIIGIVNLAKTASSGKLIKNEEVEAPALTPHVESNEGWHRVIERKPVKMLILSLIVILIGGVVEIMPTIMIESNVPSIAEVKPYSPLELEGRDLYIREGCNNCHSQMIRPLRFETKRYGEYSKAGEFVYDHPHLWGSKRTGPDLHREGGKRGDSWHYTHFLNPTQMEEKSIMPSYDFLVEDDLNMGSLKAKIGALRTVGVPYPEGFEEDAERLAKLQAKGIANNIISDLFKVKGDKKERAVESLSKKEVVAMIAYLQRLGSDIKVKDNK
ncbi:cytochrome-c oxidase, cbb3-type subunit I [Flavobacteriales bacterium]|nr:cytochrome-c oxidase, cbb3-type subunit I [Flavobacteriales bacterium]